ncbi:MAG: serine/threonine protein kinase [Cyanobacteria bacterium J06560_2]
MTSDTSPDNVSPAQSDNAPLILLSNRYKVLNVLGDGGFGKTFLVEDTHMPSNRKCVLKQLKPIHDQPALRQVVQDRFQREAATLEKLGEAHDQIPRLHAYFTEGEQFYLVEEWVEGLTLTQKVHKDGPMSEATVQAIIAKLLPAIAYVHSQKIVHRDIKPDNILLRQPDGKPVLIDFGAVKETMKTIINSGEQSTHSIVVGTPGYMPSEQLSGRPIYASDIYSLGMTAIFLLTGKIPQELGTDPQTGSLSWREHAGNISTGFANFIDCATHMSSHTRFATAQDMQFALNTLMMGQMETQIATSVAQGKEQVAPPQPNSAQTVVSSAPSSATSSAPVMGTAASYGATPANDIPAGNSADGGVNSDIKTAVVSPLADAAAVNQPRSEAYSQPTSSTQWKGPAIIGGMVGLSIVLGALVLTERLPNVIGGNSVSTEVVEPNETEDNTTEIEAAIPTPTPTPTATPTPVVAPAPANANGTVVGQSGTKNIRAGAGTNHSVVGSVLAGNRIQVTDRGSDAAGYPWYRVVTPSGQQGWIAGQLIQIDGDASPPARPTPTPTPTPSPTPTPTPPADRTNATIASREAGSKNIRSGPGTNFGVAHEAYPGDRVIIQDSAKDAGGYTWYQVSFPESGAQGWIAGQLIDRD